MPLLCDEVSEPQAMQKEPAPALPRPIHNQSQRQHSVVAKTAILSRYSTKMAEEGRNHEPTELVKENSVPVRMANATLTAPQKPPKGNSLGAALTDTPATTAPNSPRM